MMLVYLVAGPPAAVAALVGKRRAVAARRRRFHAVDPAVIIPATPIRGQGRAS